MYFSAHTQDSTWLETCEIKNFKRLEKIIMCKIYRTGTSILQLLYVKKMTRLMFINKYVSWRLDFIKIKKIDLNKKKSDLNKKNQIFKKKS